MVLNNFNYNIFKFYKKSPMSKTIALVASVLIAVSVMAGLYNKAEPTIVNNHTELRLDAKDLPDFLNLNAECT
jgi:hypothetical protein